MNDNQRTINELFHGLLFIGTAEELDNGMIKNYEITLYTKAGNKFVGQLQQVCSEGIILVRHDIPTESNYSFIFFDEMSAFTWNEINN